MKAEYINPFVDSAISILKEMCNIEIKRGLLSIQKEGIQINGVGVIIGITGSVSGRVFYGMNEDTAIKIAALMNDEDIKQVNDLVWDTLGELANIITGNSITLLSQKGYDVDITPPIIVSSNNMDVNNAPKDKMLTLVVPLHMAVGDIMVNLSLKEQK